MLQVKTDFSSVIHECFNSVGKTCHILQLMLNKKKTVFFAASGLPHSFIIMHQNRYQQCIGAFILQAASESNKVESPQPICFILTLKKKKIVVQNILHKFGFIFVIHFQKEWISKIEGAVTTLLKLDSEQPRVKSATLWLESAQIWTILTKPSENTAMCTSLSFCSF